MDQKCVLHSDTARCPPTDALHQGSANQMITFRNDDPPTFNRMLIYLYTGDYPDGIIPSAQQPLTLDECSISPYVRALMPTSATAPKVHSTDDKLMNNVNLYIMAEKYDLHHLKGRAMTRFHDLMGNETPNEKLVPVINAIYECTKPGDSGLREIITETFAQNINIVLASEDLTAVMKKFADLSFAIFMKSREIDKQTLSRLSASKATVDEDLRTVKIALRNAHEAEKGALL